MSASLRISFVIPAKAGIQRATTRGFRSRNPACKLSPGSSAESRGVLDPRVREDDKRLCEPPRSPIPILDLKARDEAPAVRLSA
jgi:hypothetical protein